MRAPVVPEAATRRFAFAGSGAPRRPLWRGVQRVRAVSPVACAGRAAGSGRSAAPGGTAELPRHPLPVGRVVERLPDATVVERCHARVDSQELRAENRVDAELGGVVDLDLGPQLRRDLLEHPVSTPLLDGPRLRRRVEVVAPDDLVGVAVGLGGVRPLPEARITGEVRLPCGCANDPARTGSRNRSRAHVPGRRSRRYWCCEAARELEEELGSGCARRKTTVLRVIDGDPHARGRSVSDRRAHAAPPRIAVKRLAPGEPTRKSRSRPRRTSDERRRLPSE